MPPAPAVSVLLPAFNRLEYLRPAVDSVLAQTLTDWELIIADDGSDGETSDYLQSLSRLPRVELLRLAHTGNPGKARNAAWRVARGKYLAFMDSDDLWAPRKLAVQLSALSARPARRWSYSALTRIGAAGAILPGEAARHRVIHDGAIFERILTFEAAVATPSVMLEHSLMEQVGGFDEQQLYFEDYDLWLRLSVASDVCAIDEPLVFVRNHDRHYTADRIAVYQARFKLLDKVANYASDAHRDLVRVERAKNAAALASAYAAAGRGKDAVRMLWRSRECAAHGADWWRRAGATVAGAALPSPLRAALRRLRHRDRTHE